MSSRLLLDTHVALWWFSANPRLNAESLEEIAQSECWLSAASVWEVAIKFKLGKLPITPTAFLDAANVGGFRLLNITPSHTIATADLPVFHSDPFDRLLLAQAKLEKLTLITADNTLLAYGKNVRCL